ncbi:hypothetical protein KA005_84780 [bacterium]|nr:hypothetical protein [bacterium]
MTVCIVRRITGIAVVLLLALSSGCSSSSDEILPSNHSDLNDSTGASDTVYLFNEIAIGMSRQQVEDLIGDPSATFTGTFSHWPEDTMDLQELKQLYRIPEGRELDDVETSTWEMQVDSSMAIYIVSFLDGKVVYLKAIPEEDLGLE